jgi:dTDP-4-dehydrorhamnose 3,5-epimerase
VSLRARPTGLPGVRVIEPDVFPDSRGFFLETFRADRYAEAGIRGPVVQSNLTRSVRGVLRGLHYQFRRPQGKILQVVRGEIFDIAADLRTGSPTFGRWTGLRLSGENRLQLYIPEGFAHGFQVLSAEADVLYHCFDLYDPGGEGGVLWNDPDLAVDWPAGEPILSAKDAALPRLAAIPADRLPVFRPDPA